MAARHGALSCDHLEYATDADAVALARAGTVAVMLPVAFYVLAETQLPPIESLRRHGVPLAVATPLFAALVAGSPMALATFSAAALVLLYRRLATSGASAGRLRTPA